MSDLIDRQAAIDALSHMCSEDESGITVSRTNVNSMLMALPSAQVTQNNRVNSNNALDTISRQAAIDLCDWYDNPSMHDDLEKLPSAQPEIVRCKNCKYWHREIHDGIEYFNFSSCDLNHYGDGNNFYCADAEPKGEQE